jgi:CDP-glucose 4,6-dehydratase
METKQGPLEGLEMTTRCGESLAGRRVFVTGHTGFKGAWLCLWLHRIGARVFGYSHAYISDPDFFRVVGVEELIATHELADIRHLESLDKAIEAADPDVIFHLAAQSLVRESYASPRETYDTNVMGTVNVLDVVRRRNKPCAVIVVTSDKCYENREQVWGYKEDDPFGGFDPYSSSKGATEIATASFRRSFFPPHAVDRHGVKVASGRAGNVIGGGDWATDRIVPDLVRSLSKGEQPRIRSPRAVRPWEHVLEPLSGYLTLADRLLTSDDPQWCDGWNFGPLPGGDLPVGELVESFIQHWGSGSWLDVSSDDQPHEANVLRLNIDKALWHLDWQPRWSVNEAIKQTVGWYLAHAEGEDMLPFSLAQIEAYKA